MPRRKPISNKQRKAELQLKRAIKRGDLDPPPPSSNAHNKTKRHRGGPRTNTNSQIVGSGAKGVGSGISSKRLESNFAKLSPEWLAHAREVASNDVLVRPIPVEETILDLDALKGEGGTTLSCPKRPKWRYDQSKKEVEMNEEGLFKKWIEETDSNFLKWRTKNINGDGDKVKPEEERSPSYFERNLEVWRQLWRVCEISQILLILMDARAPVLHYPPSVQTYISSPKPARKVILVLTKSDLVSPSHITAWKSYIKLAHPDVRIVQVESYQSSTTTTTTSKNDLPTKGKNLRQERREPHIPTPFLSELVGCLKEVHNELLTKPLGAREGWKAKVRENVDWDVLLDRTKLHSTTVAPVAAAPAAAQDDQQQARKEQGTSEENTEEDEADLRFVTIGMIGQPNVGKSSLLNALFGERKVKASRTPGKTKHFQTLFWTPEIRLVDCPGLVMPNFVPMETQVLSGILPISQISSIPSCIRYAAQRLPLEKIFKLVHPSKTAPPVEDRRTWRDGVRPDTNTAKDGKDEKWTAMEIMTAFAESKGWVTAKAGRPDVNRAGNAMLRILAEGKVAWGFWPPKTPSDQCENLGNGLWIQKDGNAGYEDHDEDVSSDEEEEEQERPSDNGTDEERESEEGEEEEEDESEAEVVQFTGGGRFGALALDDDDSGDN